MIWFIKFIKVVFGYLKICWKLFMISDKFILSMMIKREVGKKILVRIDDFMIKVVLVLGKY